MKLQFNSINESDKKQYLEKTSGEKKKKKEKSTETEDYEAPEYVVQPAKDDKGFFMYKKAFDRMKSAYTPGIKFAFADE